MDNYPKPSLESDLKDIENTCDMKSAVDITLVQHLWVTIYYNRLDL